MLEQLKLQQPELEALFVCDKVFEQQSRGLMQTVSFPVDVKTITAGKFRRYVHFKFWDYIEHFSIPIKNFFDLFRTGFGMLQSLGIIWRFHPDVVLAKGGYVCLPMGLAAWLMRVPLVIHDSDTRPGLTNRILARFASRIGTGTPLENYHYDARKTQYVGVPIDPSIHAVTDEQKRAFKKALQLDEDNPLVVAVGGGLGSALINQAILVLAQAPEFKEVNFYNVTGKSHYDAVRQHAAGVENYIADPFVFGGMFKIFAAADVVVTRASATTLQELAAAAKPVIAVPARQLGDQQKNAATFAATGAVIAIKDDDLSTQLGPAIRSLLDDTAKAHSLADKIHSYARPDAARDMAAMVLAAVRLH